MQKVKPKKHAVRAGGGEEEQPDFYLGTQPRSSNQQRLTDGIEVSPDASPRLGDGLLPRGGDAGKGAATHAVSSVDALTAAAAAIDPVESLAEAAGGGGGFADSTSTGGRKGGDAASGDRGGVSRPATDGGVLESAGDPSSGVGSAAHAPAAEGTTVGNSLQRRAGAAHPAA